MTLTTEKNSNLSSPWIIKEHFTPKENPSLKKLEKHMPRSFAGQTATLQRGCIIIAVGLISIGIVGLFVSGFPYYGIFPFYYKTFTFYDVSISIASSLAYIIAGILVGIGARELNPHFLEASVFIIPFIMILRIIEVILCLYLVHANLRFCLSLGAFLFDIGIVSFTIYYVWAFRFRLKYKPETILGYPSTVKPWFMSGYRYSSPYVSRIQHD